MRDELRRALFAATFAAAALAGCGGGGGTLGSPAPAPGAPPPPSPPPTTAGTYFLAGRAGGSGTAPSNNVPFATGAVGASKFELAYIDPNSPPLAVDFTNGSSGAAGLVLEAQGLGYDFGTFSEYFPASGGGTATGWGTRYHVYADVGPGGTGPGALYAIDLRKQTPLTAPVATQISSGTVLSLSLCSSPGAALFDNYRSANQSWIVFHALGPDTNCGTLDDQFVAVQMSMTSTIAPIKLAQLEPVEALYDTSGAITYYLAINHPAVVNGVPSTAVPLQQLNPDFTVKTTFSTKLVANGLNTAGGDFLSLGVQGNVWLYLDGAGIFALNWSTGVTSAIYTLAPGDSVGSRAVFDGTNAYVGIDNAAGSYVVMINTSTNAVTSTQTPVDATATAGITLVGVTSGNLVYLSRNAASANTTIKSLVKSNLTSLTSLVSPTGTQTIDSLMGPSGASGPPAAFLVGDTVFFTVADTSATGSTGFAKRAFYVIFAGSAPGAATPVGSGVSAVLGVLAPATIPTSGSITYSGALVVTGGGNTTPGTGQVVEPVFANTSPAVTASLGLYGPTGSLTNTIGTLSSTNPAYQTNFAFPVTGAALNGGPVQASLPAMLLLFGTDGTGAIGQDIAIFASDNSTPFAQLSGFIQ